MILGKLVSSTRGTTYYWIERNENPHAPCIVFTHGLLVNHHLFDKQVPYFSKNYTVIVWDVPLHGRSHPYLNFSYANVAAELLAILQREKIEQAVLVGQSMGGYVCQEFAARYPDRTAAFIGVDTSPFGLCYYSDMDQKLVHKISSMAKRVPEPLLRIWMAKSITKTHYAYHNALGMMEQMSKREIVNAMHAAYSDVFTRKDPVEFACPVLLTVGEYDRTGKIKEYCRAWAEKTGFPLHVIPNAAHNANADNVEEFNQIVDEFLIQSLKPLQK